MLKFHVDVLTFYEERQIKAHQCRSHTCTYIKTTTGLPMKYNNAKRLKVLEKEETEQQQER